MYLVFTAMLGCLKVNMSSQAKFLGSAPTVLRFDINSLAANTIAHFFSIAEYKNSQDGIRTHLKDIE